MLHGIIFGLIQGVAEWIPISSEGALVLAQLYLTPGTSLQDMVSLALFLHLGTFFSALLFFWKDVKKILRGVRNYPRIETQEKKLIEFLFFTTLISGVLGFFFFSSLDGTVAQEMEVTGRGVMGIIGFLLLVTAISQIAGRRKIGKDRTSDQITKEDTALTGTAQGFSALPGLSRSGLTIATLLFRGFKEEEALRLSFLMSLPIVFAGNIVLNLSGFQITTVAVVGFITAFVVGFATIKVLFAVAHRVNFGYFLLIFGLLTVLAAFV